MGAIGAPNFPKALYGPENKKLNSDVDISGVRGGYCNQRCEGNALWNVLQIAITPVLRCNIRYDLETCLEAADQFM